MKDVGSNNTVKFTSIPIISLVYIILTNFLLISCFNLNSKNPIVITDQFDKTESHFGATVLLIQHGKGFGWIVIGAPKADSPLPNYSRIKEPGLVWRCSLTESGLGNCSFLPLEPTGELNVRLGQVPTELILKDLKEFGMLGSAMGCSPSNDRFVVCSSRWSNQKYRDTHLMNGLCYWMTVEQLLSENLSQQLDFSNRLMPLVNRTRQAYAFPSPTGSGVERRFDWAFGQSGFSVDISSHNEVLLGAPGILEWAGSVIQYSDADPIVLSNFERRPNSRDSQLAHSRIPRAQALTNKKLIDYFDYFGYVVKSGKFFNLTNDDRTQYAVGAPRGNSLRGKVIVFNFNTENNGDGINVLCDPIVGESLRFFGSYFGSTIGVMDINNDGLDDLIVGAPLFESSDSTSSALSSSNIDEGRISANNSNDQAAETFSSGDEGCVFVYISKGKDFDREPQEVCGDNWAGARFGSAICPLGDINHDGIQDVAIGAPYENDGRGAVYLYTGTGGLLVFSQKLLPEDVHSSIRTFGYSLAGKIDVDRNGYGDLIVGAYSSNHVILYTSQTVVRFTGSITASAKQLKTDTGIFSIEACLSYKGKRVADQLQIWMKLSIEASEIRKSRSVEFIPDFRVQSNNFGDGKLQFLALYYKKSKQNCYAFNLTTVGDLDTAVYPVVIKQDAWLPKESALDDTYKPLFYTLQKTSNGDPIIINDPKVKVESEEISWAKRSTFPMQNPKKVGDSLSSLTIPIVTSCEEDGDPVCLAQLQLRVAFRRSDGTIFNDGEPYMIGSSRSLFLQVELTNLRERANLPITISITWSSSTVMPRSTKSDCSLSLNETNGTPLRTYACSISAALGKNKKDSLEMELDMAGLIAGTAEEFLEFQFSATTSSLLLEEASLNKTLDLTHRSQLNLIGQTTETSYYENITSKTVNFTHVYEVGLSGISPISGTYLQIAFPGSIQRDDGSIQTILRIREPIISFDGAEMQCRAINGTFHKDFSYEDKNTNLGNQLRTKRAVSREELMEINKRQSFFPLILEQEPLVINCQTKLVNCFIVECETSIFRTSERASLEIRLRLLTDTAKRLLLQNDKQIMIIESVARLERTGSIHEVELGMSRTIIRAELFGELKAWILIVAIGGGICLFILITIILMHCGFFRRAKLEELAKLKARKNNYQFGEEIELADSMEYYDGAFTESEFSYSCKGSRNFKQSRSFSDQIYDEIE